MAPEDVGSSAEILEESAMIEQGDSVGPYVMKRVLGRGAFGEVWLAEKQTPIAVQEVAVKIFVSPSPDLEDVRKEVSAWLKVAGHPNILPVIEADVFDGNVAVVSEFARGGTLAEWLALHGGRAPRVEDAVRMGAGILDGMSHLHRSEIIHRDLKPGNVLLRGGVPCIADFGLARALGSPDTSTTCAGTVRYMSPEAILGERSKRVDLWAAGVILYILLSGRAPYMEENEIRLKSDILSKPPDPLPEHVPGPLREMVMRSLERDPKRRYGGADEMRRALDAAWVACAFAGRPAAGGAQPGGQCC